MTGDELLRGPVGHKVVRLFYFITAGFVTTFAINKWRDFERDSLSKKFQIQYDQQNQQQQEQNQP